MVLGKERIIVNVQTKWTLPGFIPLEAAKGDNAPAEVITAGHPKGQQTKAEGCAGEQIEVLHSPAQCCALP